MSLGGYRKNTAREVGSTCASLIRAVSGVSQALLDPVFQHLFARLMSGTLGKKNRTCCRHQKLPSFANAVFVLNGLHDSFFVILMVPDH